MESTGPVHFYSYAIVPINQETEEIMTRNVSTQEGEGSEEFVKDYIDWYSRRNLRTLTRTLRRLFQKKKW